MMQEKEERLTDQQLQILMEQWPPAAIELQALRARVAELEAALKPFATVARIIDSPLGPVFAEDEQPFQSGCAWTENGVKKILTWGDFRRARAALKGAPQ